MATAARDLSSAPTCPTHRWPLRADGTCWRCMTEAQRADGSGVCPAHTTWDPHVKPALSQALKRVMVPAARSEELDQRFWEKLLDIGGRELGLVHDYTTPAAATLRRVTDYVNRPAPAGQDG